LSLQIDCVSEAAVAEIKSGTGVTISTTVILLLMIRRLACSETNRVARWNPDRYNISTKSIGAVIKFTFELGDEQSK